MDGCEVGIEKKDVVAAVEQKFAVRRWRSDRKGSVKECGLCERIYFTFGELAEQVECAGADAAA